MPPEYSIVIACYNSSSWLADLVAEIEAAMADHRDNFELILVNDASPDDRTWPAIVELAASRSWLRGLDLQYNVGQFMALMAGFDIAQGENIITMDDDLQHPPAELPKLIGALEQYPDSEVVIGSFAKKEHNFYRNLGSSLVHAIYTYTHSRPKQLRMSNFKIMRRAVVDTIRSHRTARPISNALLLQSTKKIVNIVVDHHPRPYGDSGYSLFRLINVTLDQVVYSSTGPLRILGLTGFGISAGSVILGLYYVVRSFAGYVGVTGFTTLVLLQLFFGGALLFSLGMVGEYVARVLKEVVGNPRYFVRQTANVANLDLPIKNTTVKERI